MNRGDVVLVRFPHPSGARGKKRPAVVIQADSYAGIVNTIVLAEITTNLKMAGDPACLFIDATSPEGKVAGLARDSVVTCLALVSVYRHTVANKLGSLSAPMIQKLDGCLKAALGLP
jgi:mRNA interferase MazF